MKNNFMSTMIRKLQARYLFIALDGMISVKEGTLQGIFI